jgi:hypothetical protein
MSYRQSLESRDVDFNGCLGPLRTSCVLTTASEKYLAIAVQLVRLSFEGLKIQLEKTICYSLHYQKLLLKTKFQSPWAQAMGKSRILV